MAELSPGRMLSLDPPKESLNDVRIIDGWEKHAVNGVLHAKHRLNSSSPHLDGSWQSVTGKSRFHEHNGAPIIDSYYEVVPQRRVHCRPQGQVNVAKLEASLEFDRAAVGTEIGTHVGHDGET